MHFPMFRSYTVPEIYFTQHLKFYDGLPEEYCIEAEIDTTVTELTNWLEGSTLC